MKCSNYIFHETINVNIITIGVNRESERKYHVEIIIVTYFKLENKILLLLLYLPIVVRS